MTNFSQVDDTYKDFSTRMDKYRAKLEAHLGIEPRLGPGADQLSLDRTSVSSVDSGVATATSRLSSTSELTSGSAATPGGSSSKASSAHGGSTSNLQETAEKRKSARRREFIMVIFAAFFKLKTWIDLQVKKFKKYKSWDPPKVRLFIKG